MTQVAWAIVGCLLLLILAVAVHHVGVRRLRTDAPALLVPAPGIVMVGAWLVLVGASVGTLGPLVVPAALIAVVPCVLLVRAGSRGRVGSPSGARDGVL